MSETTSAPVFLTVAQFCDKHPWAKPGGIRHAIFFGKDNGLEASGALVYFGRKLLLDDAKFVAWVREHGASRGSLKQGAPGKRDDAPTPTAKTRRTRGSAAA